MLAEAYLHRLDPFAVQITETFGLRWYGLAYISGFIIAWVLLRWLGKKKFILIPPERAGDILFATVLGV
ncbi:MAG TPA: prolipoprotein diacylglyceryl transferase, partial [Phycisphaerales bacterium]|nr:prolipoprotein diacylglyceryl transferase [Phycisphaerales bacterium]